jgi:hypothetical protein
LYVIGASADFDLYIYRDAYTPILAECYANQYGVSRMQTNQGFSVLDNIHANDWAMYAGVEFGNADYNKTPNSLKIIASSATTGGSIEVWLDSLESGEKIAECPISNTGDWRTFQTFISAVKPISGRHDVYLKFTGAGTGKLFQFQWFYFTVKGDTTTSVPELLDSAVPQKYGLEQNFPNPFNPSTMISYAIPNPGLVTLKIYDLLGRESQTLIDEFQQPDTYAVDFDASKLASGIYFYHLQAGSAFAATKKMLLLR